MIPIIDRKTKKIIDVINLEKLNLLNIKKKSEKLNLSVVLMAGGKGTRLMPYTSVLPKPLLPINNKPTIKHIIDRFMQYDVKNFFITINYKSEILKTYLKDLRRISPVLTVQEKKPLGTVGSLFLIKNKLKDDFFLTNCDTIIDENYSEIYKHHKNKKNDITIVTATKKIKIVYDTKEIIIDKFFDTATDTDTDFILHKMRLELVEALKITHNMKINVLQYLNKYSHMENTIMEDFKNQVCLAIDDKFYNKWGKNYINSFREAHSQERCNNFKDKSIQHYGGKLFKDMKDKIDDIYTNMPPPKPSNVFNEKTGITTATVSTAQFTRMFNNMSGGCFHPTTNVLMVGNKYKPINDVVKGDQVLDIKGNIIDVICLVKINCNDKCTMVRIDDLIITPYHPIKLDDKWVFPKDLNIPLEFECDYVYNLVLRNNHTIVVNNYIACTLAHNIIDNDVIKHEYFGTDAILNDLKKIKGYETGLATFNMNDFIRDDIGRVIGISSS